MRETCQISLWNENWKLCTVVNEGASARVVADIEGPYPGLGVKVTMSLLSIQPGLRCSDERSSELLIPKTLCVHCRCLTCRTLECENNSPIILWLTRAFSWPEWIRTICGSLHLYLKSSLSHAAPANFPYHSTVPPQSLCSLLLPQFLHWKYSALICICASYIQ